MVERMSSEMQDYVKCIIEKFQEHPVFIYGAGYMAEELYWILKRRNKIIAGFLVTAMSGNKREIDGIPISEIGELDENLKIKSFVVIATKDEFVDEIENVLKSNHILSYLKPLKNMFNLFGENFERRIVPNIEITTKIGCSIQCKYCPQRVLYSEYFKNGNEKVFMDMNTFIECTEKLPKETIITFSGFSEPFLNDSCIQMIQFAAEKGYRLTLNSTLVGLNMENAKKLVEFPIEYMVLHTPDSKENSKIPVTDEYKKVLDFLLDAKTNEGRAFIKTANCHGEPTQEILDLINGRVTFASAGLQDIAGNVSEDEVAMNLNWKGKIVCGKSEYLNRNVLLPDGSLVLCCLDYALRHVLGNLLQQSYEEIMQGEIIAAVRKKMENGEDVLCRHCCEAWLIK